MFYLDTNIFLYSIDKSSPHMSSCKKLLELAVKNDIQIATSVETIQEIIHFLKRTGKIEEGIMFSRNLMKIVHLLIPVDHEMLKAYLTLAEKYKNEDIQSRDLMHLAACLQSRLSTAVTYDNGFKIFNEIKVKKPEDVI